MSNYANQLIHIIPTDKIPDELSGVRTFIEEKLDDLFYEDFFADRSQHEDTGHYSLTLISYKRLGFDLPYLAGFKIIINPGFTGTSMATPVTKIPINFQYTWDILKHRDVFDNFDPSEPKDYFEVLITLLDLSENELIIALLSLFPDDTGTDPVTEFIDDLNNEFGTSISLSTGLNPFEQVQEIITQLFDHTGLSYADLVEFIYNKYLKAQNDVKEILDNIKKLFKTWAGNITWDKIGEMVLPQFSIAIDEISVGLEFPASIFRPVNPDVDGSTTILTYDVGKLIYDTGSGFEFINAGTFNFPKSYLLNTGLSIEITNLKIDLNKKRNFQEATDAGFSDSFKGFYIEEAVIEFPQGWSADPERNNVELVGSKILVGAGDETDEELSFSGTIEMRAFSTFEAEPLLAFNLFNDSIYIELTSFKVTFERNEVVPPSEVKGKLRIKGLKDSQNNDAELELEVKFSKDGYEFKVSEPQGIKLTIPKVMNITLYTLDIGCKDGKWEISTKGKIESLLTLPVVGTLMPKETVIEKLEYKSGEPTEYDITFTWDEDTKATLSNEEGFEFESEYEKRIDKTFLKVLKLDLIKVYVKATQDQMVIKSTIDGSLKLGPLTATVKEIGLETLITQPDGGGNLGPFETSFKLIPPKGLGLKISSALKDKTGFNGGGFLSLDHEKGIYSGVLEIDFKDKFNLKAIGILVTKMPGGEKGFSLILVITVTFNPAIDIGYGFQLAGVGGLIGLNRTVNSDYLRSGIKTGDSTKILFPEDPVTNANTLIGIISSGFPVEKDQFVFGPLAKITWGKPEPIVFIDLGLIIELDNPFRLLILGTVKALLPTQNDPKVKINIAFLGEINFTRKELLFDATIYDSKIGTATLTGDMLVRLFWGDNGGFLMTVGGFHPNFTPPPMRLPQKIARLAITIYNEDKFRLGAEAYFAITSNTIQLGAKVILFAKVSKFSIDGYASFDALIYFKPNFQFQVDVGAGLSIKSGSKELLSVDINLFVKGPGEWYARGEVTFKVIGIKVEFKFEKTFGQKAIVSLPSVDVLDELIDALKDKETWETILSVGNDLVSLKDLKDELGDIIMLPSGGLRITQKVAPLNVALKKFGNSDIDGTNLLKITQVKIASVAAQTNIFKEEFAPAEFFQLNDQEKLSSPSFKKYDSGVEVGGISDIVSACSRKMTIENELIYIDRDRRHQTRVLLPGNDYESGIQNNIASNSRFSGLVREGKPYTPQDKYNTTEKGYTVANTSTLNPHSGGAYYNTYEEASAGMAGFFAADDSIEPGALVILSLDQL